VIAFERVKRLIRRSRRRFHILRFGRRQIVKVDTCCEAGRPVCGKLKDSTGEHHRAPDTLFELVKVGVAASASVEKPLRII
jgi:hypothetical protein